MRVKTLCLALAIVAISVEIVRAASVWDAFSGFNASSNTASDLWQYSLVPNGTNAGYALLPTYGVFPYQSYNGWQANGGNFPAVGTDAGQLRIQPEIGVAAAIGWMSPIAGTVDASFSLADVDFGANGPGDHPNVPYDGVSYNLFKEGVNVPLASGYVANGGTSGLVSVAGIPVSVGTKLYLEVEHGTFNNWYDTTGGTFTITQVPEPSTLALLGIGTLGLYFCSRAVAKRPAA